MSSNKLQDPLSFKLTPKEGTKTRSFGHVGALCQARPKKESLERYMADYKAEDKVKNPEDSISKTNEGKR
jgi:hypothetical protein